MGLINLKMIYQVTNFLCVSDAIRRKKLSFVFSKKMSVIFMKEMNEHFLVVSVSAA